MTTRQGIFILIVLFSCFPALAKKNKILPKHLQKAYVIQQDAIVYTRPDFDSVQIIRIPSGSLVTISKKIHRPNSGFGTFYHIYINKPKKMKAYISEIDVVPRYIRSGSTHKMNPNFNSVKKNLSRLEDLQFNREPEKEINFSDTPISKLILLGLVTDHFWIKNQNFNKTRSIWFFNLKLNYPDFPLSAFGTHISLGFSPQAPVIASSLKNRGFYIMGNILLNIALIESSHFLFQLGGGVVFKWKQALAPEDPYLHHLAIGVIGVSSFIIRIHERFHFLLEVKLQQDFVEYKTIPGVGGGIVVAI